MTGLIVKESSILKNMETEIRDLEERIKSTDAMVCWLLVYYYTCDVLNLVELDYSNDCDVFRVNSVN